MVVSSCLERTIHIRSHFLLVNYGCCLQWKGRRIAFECHHSGITLILPNTLGSTRPGRTHLTAKWFTIGEFGDLQAWVRWQQPMQAPWRSSAGEKHRFCNYWQCFWTQGCTQVYFMADSIRFTNSKQHDRQKAAARKKFDADLGGLVVGGISDRLLVGFGAASWTDNFVKEMKKIQLMPTDPAPPPSYGCGAVLGLMDSGLHGFRDSRF